MSFIIEKSSRSALREYLVSISMLGSCLISVSLILKYKGNGGNWSLFHPLINEGTFFFFRFGPKSKLLIIGFQLQSIWWIWSQWDSNLKHSLLTWIRKIEANFKEDLLQLLLVAVVLVVTEKETRTWSYWKYAKAWLEPIIRHVNS